MSIRKLLFIYIYIFAGSLLLSGRNAQPELGQVDWLRNYQQAQEMARNSGKPMLVLFQEVPGCEGCVNFGQEVLTEPLIVDAIENEFIPLAIFNNQGGHDREILEHFKEPAWNFQVMRFLDEQGNDIIPRKDKVWTIPETISRIKSALMAYGKSYPLYLDTIADSKLLTAAFSMYCFWDGEAKLGAIEGVTETESGWLNRHEVVKLKYDPSKISWEELVKKAAELNCAYDIYAPNWKLLKQLPEKYLEKAKVLDMSDYRIAKESDQKRHLGFSLYKNLNLNEGQKTKINALLASKDFASIPMWLSKSQGIMLKSVEN